MKQDEIRQFILGGQWKSIAPELRPSISKSAAGDMQPFYLTRLFEYTAGDGFACTVVNFADPQARVPLLQILIRGHLRWQGEHAIAAGAFKVDYVADEAYAVTPLHQGAADAFNRAPVEGLDAWAVGRSQDLMGKSFPAFALSEGRTYVDYDLIYVYGDLLFNGSKHVDGRAFDKPENRPTNLQIPLVRG